MKRLWMVGLIAALSTGACASSSAEWDGEGVYPRPRQTTVRIFDGSAKIACESVAAGYSASQVQVDKFIGAYFLSKLVQNKLWILAAGRRENMAQIAT